MEADPGRIHHAMRATGMAELALALMVERAKSRVAFGGPLAEHGVVGDLIARSRIEIEQGRLLVLKTAWLIDRHGAKGARTEIAAIKVAAPAMATAVIDRGHRPCHRDLRWCRCQRRHSARLFLQLGPGPADRRRPRRRTPPHRRPARAPAPTPLHQLSLGAHGLSHTRVTGLHRALTGVAVLGP